MISIDVDKQKKLENGDGIGELQEIEDVKLHRCQSSKNLPAGEEWIFEEKLEGIRAVAYNGRLYKAEAGSNRISREITEEFPNINVEFEGILDGIITDINKSENSREINLFETQKNECSKKYAGTKFVAFDILKARDKDLRGFSLYERKQALHALRLLVPLMKNIEIINYTDDGQELWEKVLKEDLGGIIAKSLTSSYSKNDSRPWMKIDD